MGIHEDAQQGKLTKDALLCYLSNNPDILNEQDPATGRAPLSTAAVAGFADEVDQLLKKRAKADALSRDGETALLLTTRPKVSKNRPRIVQLLLSKMLARSVDATTAADGNNTPLMFAVLHGDVESIRLLVNAGASLTATNDKGQTAVAMAADKAVALALDVEKNDKVYAKRTDVVGSLLLYIVAWINNTNDDVAERLLGLNPKLNEDTDDKVNAGETPDKDQFVKNIDDFVNRNPTLEYFFKGNPKYIQELAKKATQLKEDSSTPLGCEELLPKTIAVTLHQQVIYCDDSHSMKRYGRWEAQVGLVQKIARITTRVLPDGDGVALRFINQDVSDDSERLSLQQIGGAMSKMSWKLHGETEIGTYLKSKILEPLVYRKLESKTLARPLLVSVITDGMPSVERRDAFVEVIKECGDKLQGAGYPRGSVKFVVGLVGTAESAAKFLNRVGTNRSIDDMVFVTTDRLDEMLAAFKENERDLDRWLIELLFSPIKNYT